MDEKNISVPAGASPVASRRQALLQLAERCEREEPSLELNLAIFLAIRPEWQDTRTLRDRKGHLIGPMLVWNESTKDCRKVEEAVADLTRSLDAAVTLVPEGFAWATQGDVRGDASVDKWGEISEQGKAKTPARALCAAALRARAAAAAVATEEQGRSA